MGHGSCRTGIGFSRIAITDKPETRAEAGRLNPAKEINMNTYEIKGYNKFNGNSGTWDIQANSEVELRKTAFGKGLEIESIRIVAMDIAIEDTGENTQARPEVKIVDAEELLYEMDANGCDEITTLEGFGQTKTYSRSQILEYLNLSI